MIETLNTPTIETLLGDHGAFNDFVYTPLQDALVELKKRRSDKTLTKKIMDYLQNDLPDCFMEMPRSVHLTYIATPNTELLRFLNITDNPALPKRLIFEFTDDKFIPSNLAKRYLGKLHFSQSIKKETQESIALVDIEAATHKKLSEIKTTWDESLVEFHHKILFEHCPNLPRTALCDMSQWYRKHGPRAKDFYAPLLSLFLANGVLFENYIIGEKNEKLFAREIFLPAFIKVYEFFGVKPLIIPLEPIAKENDKEWLRYPNKASKIILEKYRTTPTI